MNILCKFSLFYTILHKVGTRKGCPYYAEPYLDDHRRDLYNCPIPKNHKRSIPCKNRWFIDWYFF